MRAQDLRGSRKWAEGDVVDPHRACSPPELEDDRQCLGVGRHIDEDLLPQPVEGALADARRVRAKVRTVLAVGVDHVHTGEECSANSTSKALTACAIERIPTNVIAALRRFINPNPLTETGRRPRHHALSCLRPAPIVPAIRFPWPDPGRYLPAPMTDDSHLAPIAIIFMCRNY